MRGTLRIGRLFGIDILLDWTWVLLLGLITWNITAVFRAWHPTWVLASALLLAVVSAGGFFASLLAHELTHAFVARRFGMRVRRVRLFLFGGVSDIEREPSSPAAEFWMAIAGPIVSLMLGASLMLLSHRIFGRILETEAAMARLSPLKTVLFLLGPINIALGLLNLVPALPLDGGRVLHAAIWKATGDLGRATHIAATSGSIIGAGFVLLGIGMVLGIELPVLGSGLGGLWLALIGMYLRVGADRSVVALATDDALEGVRVATIMRRHGTTVDPTASLRWALDEAFTQASGRALPVVEGDRLVGLLCINDVRKVPPPDWEKTPVGAVMTPATALSVVGPEDDAHDAFAQLADRDVSQVPVVAGDHLVGMFSRRDVARWLELSMTAAKRLRPRGLPVFLRRETR